jgi:glutamyl-tRNA reductase
MTVFIGATLRLAGPPRCAWIALFAACFAIDPAGPRKICGTVGKVCADGSARLWHPDLSDFNSMTSGKLFLVGATHRTAPLGIRERLALATPTESALADELESMPGMREFVILNTCNRVEIYAVADSLSHAGSVAAAFCARQGLELGAFEEVRLLLTGSAAVRHLLEVASGLDSQMIGENEIFGQVKKAYLTAQSRGSAGPVLNRVFQKAFNAAKHVRSQTGITGGLVSVANVAVDLATSIFGTLADRRILLLGAGEIGLKSARAFKSRGAASIVLASRRVERAEEVAAELNAGAMPFETALNQLADFDVVVCSTSAAGTVVSTAAIAAAVERRGGVPLFFIDLAMPRDVEANAASLPNVYLYNLDDLARISAENRAARQTEIEKCQIILDDRSSALWFSIERLLEHTGASTAGDEQMTGNLCGAV